ncbi:MAG: nucleoside monophosphate kinase [Holosporales bacterium]|jgi:adenylate kinase|nr:nucleoside monophosphate kinase [Holosporales bacterium]
MILLLFGCPGSGKGTQAQRLVSECGFSHVSTGELLRREIVEETPIGLKVADVVKSGGLVSDVIVTQVVNEHLPRLLEEKDVILDGYPRALGQVEALDVLCASLPHTEIHAIYLNVDPLLLEDRLLRRASCEACGTIGALKTEGTFVCSFCGGEKFVQRQDDNKQVVQIRLKEYWKVTAPILQVYRKRKQLLEIDGSADTEIVFQKIKEVIAGF